jgi:hypothetical protein
MSVDDLLEDVRKVMMEAQQKYHTQPTAPTSPLASLFVPLLFLSVVSAVGIRLWL